MGLRLGAGGGRGTKIENLSRLVSCKLQTCSGEHTHPPTLTMLASVEDERQSQLEYWKHHVAIEATVETMMLDSQAAAIDSLERPEILGA